MAEFRSIPRSLITVVDRIQAFTKSPVYVQTLQLNDTDAKRRLFEVVCTRLVSEINLLERPQSSDDEE